MQTGKWDGYKLLIFMNVFNVRHSEIADKLNVERGYITHLTQNKKSFEPYNERLTAIKNAIKKAKIAEVQTYAQEMISHYNSFE